MSAILVGVWMLAGAAIAQDAAGNIAARQKDMQNVQANMQAVNNASRMRRLFMARSLWVNWETGI